MDKESRIILKSVHNYRCGSDYMPLEKSGTLLGIEAYFPDMVFPENSLTMLYGHRNPALEYMMRDIQENHFTEAVGVEVAVQGWISRKLDLVEGSETYVGNTTIMNLLRVKRDILDEAASVAQVWLKPEQLKKDGWPTRGTAYPHLAGHLRQREGFKHVDVICYPVYHPKVGMFQVATVFNTAIVDLSTVDGGTRLIDVKFALKKEILNTCS